MSVCAVVPAAGRGSRLGLGGPKLLVPVTERDTIWSLVSARLQGLVDHIHVIVSPADLELFEGVLDEHPLGTPVTTGVQAEPVGMGDAVFRGHPRWSRADVVLVIWGDQVHVSRETVEAAIQLHRNAPRRVVLPLVPLADPYVEYVFTSTGRLTAVRQTREGDRCRPGGLGDVGTFVLSTRGLRDEWEGYLAETTDRGALTAEVNFLPFLVFLASRGWEVLPLGVADPLEAMGINTPADLEFFRTLYA
ncbi:MAG TPA: NTP transferase domain-containing protein [Umezawaea sp.]|nr:NTP transferase domain-containing protein [Umezawaea sp.]